jgi:hypothetical protein
MKTCLANIIIVSVCAATELAGAATLTVTSTADADDYAPGTLRAALASAKDGDTIDATGVSGVILLGDELPVFSSVTILGPGPDVLSVAGDGWSRVFHVYVPATATISGLTITNGYADYFNSGAGILGSPAGGGIWNEGAILTVSNCVVNGNSAGPNSIGPGPDLNGIGGGILNDGTYGNATLTVVNCKIIGNVAAYGGGILNLGPATLTINNSTISGNVACFGGGIYNGWGDNAFMLITGSTISSNSAFGSSYFGYGVGSLGQGGGIVNGAAGSNATLIANCTISGNSSFDPGGASGIMNYGYYGNAPLTIINSTFSGNSTASGDVEILNYGEGGSAPLQIGSTILNAGASGVTISNVLGAVISLGYNLSSDDSGGLLTNSTDLINTDPMLGPLQDNGGPTFTHALLPGSPAIDQGKNLSGSAYDQRGAPFVRTFDDPFVPNAPGGEGTDIGAFEMQTSTVTPAQAVQHLLDLVSSHWRRPQPLSATLDAALASVERGNVTAAVNQLQAFQSKVRAQVAPSDPLLAGTLLQEANGLIISLTIAH